MSIANSIGAESFVLFELAGNTCAVRSLSVQSVEMVEHITAVPNTATFVEGVTHTRGRVIPSINLRIRFGFPRIPTVPKTRMLVIRSKDRTVGMLVDSAREFVFIPADSIQPGSETVTGVDARYVEGIATLGNRVVLILNLGKVFDEVK